MARRDFEKMRRQDRTRRSKATGTPRPDWRGLPLTVRQVRALRARGLNPILYATRGAAHDVLTPRKKAA